VIFATENSNKFQKKTKFLKGKKKSQHYSQKNLEGKLML
jgi:hypothetical protein